jgi:hypothetical protein
MSQIPFLVAQTTTANGILVTGNYQFVTISCPNLATQSSAPTISSTSTATTGGTLTHSTTYGYKITTLTPAGETTPSAESTRATGAGTDTNTVTVNFTAAVAGTSTNIYGRTSGGPWGLIGNAAAGIATFVDDGSVTPGAAPPAANTTQESVTVTINMPDGQTAPQALNVNGTALTFTASGAAQVFFGGPNYVITKTGTITATGVYVDFGGRVA